MKRILITFLIIPAFCFSQNSNCGDRPIKPPISINETKKDYKKSEKYLDYKQALKHWKRCVSPTGIGDEIDANLEKKIVKQVNKPIDECGDAPKKPKRLKNQSIDEYRKTAAHIEYRKKMKEWKKCMSPIKSIQRISSDHKELKNDNGIINPCGYKPEKPIRQEGLNHEEYRNTPKHIEYRKKMKEWKACIKSLK